MFWLLKEFDLPYRYFEGEVSSVSEIEAVETPVNGQATVIETAEKVCLHYHYSTPVIVIF